MALSCVHVKDDSISFLTGTVVEGVRKFKEMDLEQNKIGKIRFKAENKPIMMLCSVGVLSVRPSSQVHHF